DRAPQPADEGIGLHPRQAGRNCGDNRLRLAQTSLPVALRAAALDLRALFFLVQPAQLGTIGRLGRHPLLGHAQARMDEADQTLARVLAVARSEEHTSELQSRDKLL